MGDDAALLEQKGQMMPRGVAGTSLLYKILGAQAFEGANLDTVHAQGQKILENMWTFGVSMESCSLPGKAKSHELEADQIEIGMGIHGEPGREKAPWMKIEQLVAQLLGDLKKYYGSGELVVMVNSLGNVTPLEMTLIVNMVLTWLKKAGDTVLRVVSGPVMTSLDMNGMSLTVLNVSKFDNKDKVI